MLMKLTFGGVFPSKLELINEHSPFGCEVLQASVSREGVCVMNVCVCASTCVCVWVCVHACEQMCLSVCLYASVWVCAGVSGCLQTFLHYFNTVTPTPTRTNTHMTQVNFPKINIPLFCLKKHPWSSLYTMPLIHVYIKVLNIIAIYKRSNIQKYYWSFLCTWLSIKTPICTFSTFRRLLQWKGKNLSVGILTYRILRADLI